ncbi:MAG: CDP-alcohol phosphatidyltransferase family protein [Euryarchaeota archaeon]|nr:CDP-alcohol phosphatidyltransferase family protein [Euryarchaeota archaeon]
MLSARFRGVASALIMPFARLFAALGLSPNLLTLMGLLASVATAFALAAKRLELALLFLLLTGFFDAIDGAVARLTRRESKFGAFLDATLDRYADAAVIIGIALYLESHYLLAFMALLGCFMVSYTRARAELFIPRCDVGLGERAERLLIIIIALLLALAGVLQAERALYYALLLVALLSHSTALERIFYTYAFMKKGKEL